MKKNVFLYVGIAATLLSGCATKTRVISDAESQEIVTANLSDNDFENAAQVMVDDLLSIPIMEAKSNGKPYYVYFHGIKNLTSQRLDVNDLSSYIENQLIKSGKVEPTRGFGEGRDESIAQARDLAESALVDKSTVKKYGTVKAYDYSLTGRIKQKDSFVDGGQKLIEYKFDLELNNAETGTKVWGKVKNIKKLTDEDTITW